MFRICSIHKECTANKIGDSFSLSLSRIQTFPLCKNKILRMSKIEEDMIEEMKKLEMLQLKALVSRIKN